ncbi:unnamed protein product [Boreogadus saida]
MYRSCAKCCYNEVEVSQPQTEEMVVWSQWVRKPVTEEQRTLMNFVKETQNGTSSEMLELFNRFKQVTWNFSEKSHGKGAPDGVGGAVKRIADSSVNMGVDIQTTEEFYRFLKERQASSKIKFLWVCEEDIRKYDESGPEVVPLVKGTMGIHQILSTEPGTILHRELSCFCSRPDICQCYKTTMISFRTSSAEASVNVQQGLTGKFVLVRYEEQPFVGQVLQVFEEPAPQMHAAVRLK